MGRMVEVNALGLPCPLPIVRLAAAVGDLGAGDTVVLLASDPAVEPDLQAWCEATGHTLREGAWAEDVFRAVIEVIEKRSHGRSPGE